MCCSNSSIAREYDVHPNGDRFLMVAPGDESAKVVVVVSWIEELKARMEAPGR